MTVVSEVQALTDAVFAEFNRVAGFRGALANLDTAAQDSLVSAINEVVASVASASGIDDGTTSASVAWSASKIVAEITAAVDAKAAQIIGTAGTDFNELGELLTEIVNNQSALAGINTALGLRVRVDASQSLSTAQQLQARSNIAAASSADVGSVVGLDLATRFANGLSY